MTNEAMTEYQTNFGFLLDVLQVGTAELCAYTGADKTLVSRWRTGKRRLMSGRHWVASIANCFLDADERRATSVLSELLKTAYPSRPLDTREQRHAVLCTWLASSGGKQADYQLGRTKLLDYLQERAEKIQEAEELEEPAALSAEHYSTAHLLPPDLPEELPRTTPSENREMLGLEGVRSSVLMSLELVLAKKEPQEVYFVCPQGLDLYTQDERFGTILMNKLMELFAAGHRFSVVLRTDYKMSEVSAFSGRWLMAHLLGYVRSYYYDDFRNVDCDKMLFVLENQFAMKVAGGRGSGGSGLSSTIYFDTPTVSDVFNECRAYRQRSTQRFHYGLFEKPDGFLREVTGYLNQKSYLIASMPTFGVAPPTLLMDNSSITEPEAERLIREFPQLFHSPEDYAATATVRHIFCEDTLEDALLKSRFALPEVSAMLGREVYLNTQILVHHIAWMHQLVLEHKNYEVCFLSAEHFANIPLQLGVWGDKAAVGWVNSGGTADAEGASGNLSGFGSLGNSTACKDYTNVGALHGFCDMVWDRIPGLMKSRGAARRKLATWLKKAAKYGYTVDKRPA